MRIVGVQYDIVWEDRAANFAVVRDLLVGARVQPGDLIVLPEMFSTGFTMAVDRACEGEPASAEQFLSELAGTYKAYVMGGVARRLSAATGANQAVVCGPDGAVCCRYTKLHPFSPGGEHRHYPGGDGVRVCRWHQWTLAPFICYDVRFPEAFRRALGQGAELFVVIANFPKVRLDHWTTLLRARAIENQCFVVGVNRTGRDPHQQYAGHSCIVAPDGRVIADAGDAVGVLGAEIDYDALVGYRQRCRFLNDMRHDLLTGTGRPANNQGLGYGQEMDASG
jgi:omega-amidase